MILQIKRDYIKIDRLPENHLSFSEMQNLGAKKLFNLFIETYEENYAFSKERNLNWTLSKLNSKVKFQTALPKMNYFSYWGKLLPVQKTSIQKLLQRMGKLCNTE